MFLRHLARHEVSVSGGWRVDALEPGDDGVRTTVVHDTTGATRKIFSRYVVGADGGRSTVRALSGIAREGAHATEKQYRLVVRTEDVSDRLGPVPSGTNIVFNQHAHVRTPGVAQHHAPQSGGGPPSPWTFLAASHLATV